MINSLINRCTSQLFDTKKNKVGGNIFENRRPQVEFCSEGAVSASNRLTGEPLLDLITMLFRLLVSKSPYNHVLLDFYSFRLAEKFKNEVHHASNRKTLLLHFLYKQKEKYYCYVNFVNRIHK